MADKKKSLTDRINGVAGNIIKAPFKLAGGVIKGAGNALDKVAGVAAKIPVVGVPVDMARKGVKGLVRLGGDALDYGKSKVEGVKNTAFKLEIGTMVTKAKNALISLVEKIIDMLQKDTAKKGQEIVDAKTKGGKTDKEVGTVEKAVSKSNSLDHSKDTVTKSVEKNATKGLKSNDDLTKTLTNAASKASPGLGVAGPTLGNDLGRSR